jgi:hypothetical protein
MSVAVNVTVSGLAVPAAIKDAPVPNTSEFKQP